MCLDFAEYGYFCCLLFFFFFQAEDGIRDWSVTGVQTCALPISLDEIKKDFKKFDDQRLKAIDDVNDTASELKEVKGMRSEERRVGRESVSGRPPAVVDDSKLHFLVILVVRVDAPHVVIHRNSAG